MIGAILRKPVNECVAMLDAGWKCHFVGSALSLVLVSGAFFMQSFSIDANVPLEVGEEQITEDEARQLCGLVETYREDFLAMDAQNRSLDERKRLIADWLPDHIDPLTEQERIGGFARANEVEILTLRPGQIYSGARVGVWSVQCEVKSSYRGICRWINALSMAEHPIACRSIELRKVDQERVGGNSHEQMCSAKVELRVPFRGEHTAAAQIKPSIETASSTKSPAVLVKQRDSPQEGGAI